MNLIKYYNLYYHILNLNNVFDINIYCTGGIFSLYMIGCKPISTWQGGVWSQCKKLLLIIKTPVELSIEEHEGCSFYTRTRRLHIITERSKIFFRKRAHLETRHEEEFWTLIPSFPPVCQATVMSGRVAV